MSKQEIQSHQGKQATDGRWVLLIFGVLIIGVILLGWLTL